MCVCVAADAAFMAPELFGEGLKEYNGFTADMYSLGA